MIKSVHLNAVYGTGLVNSQPCLNTTSVKYVPTLQLYHLVLVREFVTTDDTLVDQIRVFGF